jgi:hypothetical protein|tara:strand:- start:29485 stop:29898 length:414 start_codon:yes stop_codon:yes gene_type:complete
MSLIQSLWNLVVDTIGAVLTLVGVLLSNLWDLLLVLHMESPRLEGLLIGVTLAWVMMRRDKHPILRALSAPLKLVLDILDLAWDQAVELVQDVWGSAVDIVESAVKQGMNLVSSSASWAMSKLKSVRNKLRKKQGDE